MDLPQLIRFMAADLQDGRSGRHNAAGDLDSHLDATMGWLCRAQDAYAPGGVSIDYSLMHGWRPGYPETTGYIIPTFVKYAALSGNDDYLKRAIRMADWELSIQEPDGSFKGGPWGSGLGSFVFDTGQILFGLIEAHRVTRQDKYLQAAVRAADWLLATQDPAGMWRRCTYHDIAHVYYARVAWGMAELGNYVDSQTYKESARRNVDWVLTQQLPNGWFDTAGFTEAGHRAPFTHTIAYTIEGVLATGVALGRNDYVSAAARSADALLHVCQDGFFHGTYNRDWASRDRYSCLTGDAQIAAIFLRLREIRGEERFLPAARAINRFISRCQYLDGAPQTAGAISGSYPIWGGYQRFTFPNWAAKFFADALLLEKSALTASARRAQHLETQR
jgi:uncharacterized protein YyaL (SSP411 family)